MTKESESWKILVDSDGYVVGFKEDKEKATQSEWLYVIIFSDFLVILENLEAERNPALGLWVYLWLCCDGLRGIMRVRFFWF